jgi:predicted nucleotidyltransferase/DNA-binding XRE family transcriptional regulator
MPQHGLGEDRQRFEKDWPPYTEIDIITFMTTVAQVIRDARVGAGLTQSELARRAGTSQPALARYETGNALPTLPTLERLLAACGKSLELRAGQASGGKSATSLRGRLGEQALTIRQHRRDLLAAARAHGVRRLRVFGSVARGEASAGSDIDFLVDLAPGRTLLDLAAFRHQAETITGLDVDVATPDMLKDRIRAEVLSEAIPV